MGSHPRRVMCVGVHPDDETLGCGGTLLRHKAEGDEIYWLLITGEEDKVEKAYQFNGVHRLKFATRCLDGYPLDVIIKKVANIFNTIEPNILYLPFCGDAHSDHRITFEAVHSATKVFRFPFIKKVLMMETISETEFGIKPFKPNHFVDITEFLERKVNIMKLYSTEIGDHPFPRSIRNIRSLATFRGGNGGV